MAQHHEVREPRIKSLEKFKEITGYGDEEFSDFVTHVAIFDIDGDDPAYPMVFAEYCVQNGHAGYVVVLENWSDIAPTLDEMYEIVKREVKAWF